MSCFGEVQYFFQLKLNGKEEAVALISQYSQLDVHLLEESSGTLMVSTYQGQGMLQVILIKQINSCVAMVPSSEPAENQYFVCPKIGLEMAQLAGVAEEIIDDN